MTECDRPVLEIFSDQQNSKQAQGLYHPSRGHDNMRNRVLSKHRGYIIPLGVMII